MTWLRVAPEVCEAFPGLRIDAAVATGFRGGGEWPAVTERLRTCSLTPASPAADLTGLPHGEPDR